MSRMNYCSFVWSFFGLILLFVGRVVSQDQEGGIFAIENSTLSVAYDWTFDCTKGIGQESVAEFTVRVFVTDDATAQGTYDIDFDVSWGVEGVDDTFGDKEGLEFGMDYTYPNSYTYTEAGLYDVEFKATIISSSDSSIEQLLDISGQVLLEDGSCTYPYVAPLSTDAPTPASAASAGIVSLFCTLSMTASSMVLLLLVSS